MVVTIPGSGRCDGRVCHYGGYSGGGGDGAAGADNVNFIIIHIFLGLS